MSYYKNFFSLEPLDSNAFYESGTNLYHFKKPSGYWCFADFKERYYYLQLAIVKFAVVTVWLNFFVFPFDKSFSSYVLLCWVLLDLFFTFIGVWQAFFLTPVIICLDKDPKSFFKYSQHYVNVGKIPVGKGFKYFPYFFSL